LPDGRHVKTLMSKAFCTPATRGMVYEEGLCCQLGGMKKS
jgi:hypothetical protein